MKSLTKKNIHVPLSENLYLFLKEEAARAHQSLSQLARIALSEWLVKRKKALLHQKISDYAAEAAGKTDLDEDLESASIQHLMEEG